MTVGKLIKELQKIEKKYGKRMKVMCACKDMYEGSNEVFTHVEVGNVDIALIDECDGDGFIERFDVIKVILS